MNKNLYILLIVFLGLTAAAILTNSILSFAVGAEMYTLDSYVAWFSMMHITALIGSILLLKYYYYRGYRFAFVTAIIAIVANFSYAAVIYMILTSGGFKSYYMPAALVSLGAIILYAVSLTFSDTRKRFWLKLAGICTLVIGLVVLLAVIFSVSSKDSQLIGIFGKILQWSPIAGGLLNVFFIMNFLDEIRTLKDENTIIRGKKSLENIFGFLAIVAFALTIALGTSLLSDSHMSSYWRNYNTEQAQQLVKLAGGPRTFTDSKGNSLHYLLIRPQQYDPQKKYPLVVSLPYGGYEASAAELLSTDRRSEYSAFLFVPYCPQGKGWGGIPGEPSLDSLVYAAINALTDPGIDIKRRYVTGVSRGGYGAWQFICTRPDMFAAAVPVSAGGDPKLASKAVDVAVWAFHGAKDKNVPVSGSRDMIAAMKKAGGHPKYTEFPGEGHSIWDRVSKTPGLWDWLFAQKRE